MKNLYKEFRIQRNINKININYIIYILFIFILLSIFFNIKLLKTKANIKAQIELLNSKKIEFNNSKDKYSIKNEELLNMDKKIETLKEIINLNKNIIKINYNENKYYLTIKDIYLNKKIDLKNNKINVDEIKKKENYFEINYEVEI